MKLVLVTRHRRIIVLTGDDANESEPGNGGNGNGYNMGSGGSDTQVSQATPDLEPVEQMGFQ
jgi:hypothetical protein